MSPDVFDTFESILKKYHAEEAHRASEFLDLTDAVIDGALPIAQMPVLITQAFGVSEEVAKHIACDVAGLRLLPLENFVPGVAEQIVTWGGKVEDYPKKRVGKTKMTVVDFGNEITEKLSLDFSEVLVKRLGFLVKSYFAGERTRESALTFFSRAPSIGGLGIDPDISKRLMDEIDAMREGVEVIAEEEVAAVQSEAIEVPAEALSTSTALEIAPSHELAAEVPVISAPAKPLLDVSGDLVDAKEVAPQARAAAKLGKIAEPVKDALESAVTASVEAAAEVLMKKNIPKKVFADVARAAIRGLRDLYQSREVMARDFAVEHEDLEDLTEAIEKGYAAYHKKEEKQEVTAPRMATPAVAESPAILDQRFAAMTGTMPKRSVDPVLSEARVSLARSAEEETAIQAQKIDPAKIEEARITARPEPVRPQLTVGSVPPPPPGTQKVVTDIRAARRLLGPVEQLGTMTPVEFRRLSTTPAEAVQKIEDLLLALEQQSYEDRVKGVKAWRMSPINQMYLNMTSEALQQGIAIAEVASRRRGAGEESLSPAEIRAIAALNERVRF